MQQTESVSLFMRQCVPRASRRFTSATRRARTTRIVPHRCFKRDEVGRHLDEARDLGDLVGIGDARQIEYLPPTRRCAHGFRQSLRRIGAAEHQIIGTRFARRHCVVAADKAADADDMIGLHRLERGIECVAGRRNMHAVSFDRPCQLRIPDKAGDPRAAAPAPKVFLRRRRHAPAGRNAAKTQATSAAASAASKVTEKATASTSGGVIR